MPPPARCPPSACLPDAYARAPVPLQPPNVRLGKLEPLPDLVRNVLAAADKRPDDSSLYEALTTLFLEPGVCLWGVCGGVRDGTAACSQLAGWLAGAGGIHKWPWPLLGRHVNTARQQQSPQRACGKTSGLRACPRHSLSAACRVCVPLAAGVSLADRMRPFQREGVQFGLRAGGRVLIGDEMGLGKTVQACALAKCYQAEWPVLVVTPSSLR